MIYLNAKRVFSYERATDPKLSFEILNALLPDLSSRKVIYAIGKGAESCSSYISASLLRAGVSVIHCRASSFLEPKQRFIRCGSCISPADICELAERLASSALEIYKLPCAKSHRLFDTLPLSPEEFAFLCGAHLFAESDAETVIFEVSDGFFEDILSKLSIIPTCVIITSLDEERTTRKIALIPTGVSNVIRYSNVPNYDFISREIAPCGARISTVSKNKLTLGRATPCGREFYYNSEGFNIRSIEERGVIYASLSIECLRALSVPRAATYQGLAAAHPLSDPNLLSISPLVYSATSNDVDLSCFEGKRIVFLSDEKEMSEQDDLDVAVIIKK